jgi:hypothetical protein
MGSAEGHASKNAVQSDEQACIHWNDLHRIQESVAQWQGSPSSSFSWQAYLRSYDAKGRPYHEVISETAQLGIAARTCRISAGLHLNRAVSLFSLASSASVPAP